jgi:hypothetical protein
MSQSTLSKDRRFNSVGNEPISKSENVKWNASPSNGEPLINVSNEKKLKKINKLNGKEASSFLKERKFEHISNLDLKLHRVILPDDRTAVVETEYPYNAICLLLIKDKNGNE